MAQMQPTHHNRSGFSLHLSPFVVAFAAFLAFSFILLPLRHGVYLRWMEDMSFYDSSDYAAALMLAYPGGLLQLAGSWLTQLMHYPWIGSTVLIAIWSATILLSVRAFRLGRFSSLLAFVPPLALLASILVMDEAWITIPSQGYIFSQSLGVAVAVVLYMAYSLSSGMAHKWIWMAVMILSFPLFGFYSLLAWLLAAVGELMGAIRERDFLRLVLPAAGAVLAVAIPYIYYLLWEGCWAEPGGIWLKGLPDFSFALADLYLWTPFIIMTLSLVLLPTVPFLRQSSMPAKFARGTAVALPLCAAVWCVACSSKPEQFRAMALMQHYMQQNDWRRIRTIMHNIKEQPSTEMVLISHLADNLLGMESTVALPRGEDAAEEDGGMRKNTSYTRTSQLSVPLYYYIGRPNLSYRWAMEHTVRFGKRAFYLKYMMKCALTSGDYRLARRYCDMLGSTLSHRDYAERYRKFIDHPELIKEDSEFAAIPADTSTEIFY